MQCYTELTPPTGVKHCLSLPLTSSQSNNLVVAQGSRIQIFTTKLISTEIDNTNSQASQTRKPSSQYDSRINDDDGLESSFLGGDAVLLRADRTNHTKLVLVAEYNLAGWVAGLARIKIQNSKSGGDALLIACRDAKLSLTEWDPTTHSLETISIHYYEQEDLQGAPWDAPLSEYPTNLTADPGSRCAALSFGHRSLAILPFLQADGDIDMDDWDEDLDGPRPIKERSAAALKNGTSNHVEDTPYSASFVLRLPALDHNLLHPVHLAFLHEYKEPTFGIISSNMYRTHQPIGRKDHFTYNVFTLDLQQKASTIILSVTGLPQDLFRVVPLPAPIGGALLVGCNELIHIDQSGRSNGVAVNTFTRQMTDFSLGDQSDLELKLEHCVIELLSVEAGELLMVLEDGKFAIIMFNIDGRTVSGISVRPVAPDSGGLVMAGRVSSVCRLNKSTLFAGSEHGDSLVIGWTRKQTQITRRKSRLVDTTIDFDVDEEDMEDDDDLYAEAPQVSLPTGSSQNLSKIGDLVFQTHDSLLSIAPIGDMTCGKPVVCPGSEEQKNSVGVVPDLQLACAVGKGRAGAIAVLNREIQPKVIGRFEFPEARGFWTMCVQKPIPKSLQGDRGPSITVGGDYDTATQYDKFMIVSKVDLDGYETSDVYALTSAGFEALTGTEFDPAAGFTIEAGTMGNHMRLIQVLKSEVRCYDGGM
jgi:cleavage and polyadenylation specificity factor subunit 1